VITPDVADRLAAERATTEHRLVAPTLLRSQLLARLYGDVRAGTLDRREADARLDHVRALRIRLLGGRVLQRVAWEVAEALGHPDTCLAEYVALTRLQADALVTLDDALASAAAPLVAVAPLEALLAR
jgi:predicted nucleic acid-binding protein